MTDGYFRMKVGIMGILNVTPDSFSDGGKYLSQVQAVRRAVEMEEEGADIIDLGAESSRPGAEAVDIKEELRRLKNILPQVVREVNIPVSIDSYKPEVIRYALENGAAIVNDITGGRDERVLQLAKEFGAKLVLMHMKGRPKTMQGKPVYKDVVSEVREFLLTRAEKAREAGIKKKDIIIDPGIGFGKMPEHNLELLRNMEVLVKTGYEVLAGISRKSFLGVITGREKPGDRMSAGLAATILLAQKGVRIFRTHDVRQTRDALAVWERIGYE